MIPIGILFIHSHIYKGYLKKKQIPEFKNKKNFFLVRYSRWDVVKKMLCLKAYFL